MTKSEIIRAIVSMSVTIFLVSVCGVYTYRRFTWLTCKGEMGEGPRRLLLIFSVPFFWYLVAPGILFWFLTRLVLWIINGFKQDRRAKDSTKEERADDAT